VAEKRGRAKIPSPQPPSFLPARVIGFKIYLLIKTMKNSKKCPKCSSVNIIYMPGNKLKIGDFIQPGTTILSAIKLSRYICGDCGYIERWIENKNDLNKLSEKYK